ncbi:MAG TPA: alkaline phosphatase family protein [Candidatus Angelobacter sp.]|nr:alkaline phosphatase family protein [Candidatus Angelobacter sp.]
MLRESRTIFVLCGLFLAVIFVAGCAGGSSATPKPTPTPTPAPTPAPTPTPSNLAATLTASPATISAGQFSTIAWTTANATSVTISPAIPQEDVNNMPLSGQGAVTPTQTTTYTLTATGPGGATTATATVTVSQVAPTIQFSAQPTAVASGGSSTLTWSTSNATSLSIDNGIGAVSPASGSVTTKSITQPTTFTATAQGPGGSTTATATVAVSPLTVTLTATPSTVSSSSPPGNVVTLSWTSTDAVSISIDQGVNTVCTTQPTCQSGTVTVNPTRSTTYTATATDPNGVTTTSKTVVTLSGALQKSINHIIWLVQENRSFDSYFGKLGLYRVSKGLPEEVNGIDNDAAVTLLDQQGNPRHPFHYQTVCTDNLTPAWNESHFDVDAPSGGTIEQGKMDNFMKTTNSVPNSDPSGSRAMGYYTEADLPFYYALATQFGVSDNMFSPVLSNTIPNRIYLFTGTSFGTIYPGSNPSTGKPEFNPASFQQKTIFDLLNQNNISWKYYFQDNSIFLASFSDWTNADGTSNTSIQGHVFPISDYFKILGETNADQLLPQVVFIERGGTSAATDEHPDNNVQTGSAAVSQMINALIASSAWPDSAFILTFDEGGGLYDHVPPIALPAPDSQPPDTQNVPFTVLPGDFTNSGFRVPFVMVSPWVIPNFVSHKSSDTTSILKFIETRFNLPPLTLRDGSAAVSDLTDFFNFSSPQLLTVPPLPQQPTNGACKPSLETGP